MSCFCRLSAKAQTAGCTDPLAINFNAAATDNDGTCLYASTTVTPLWSAVLSDSLTETSGLVLWNNRLWTHNDNGDINLYALDTFNGTIVQTCELTPLQNGDWEEIEQDSAFIYIGDIGNNQNGNRQDLRIYRITKQGLCASPLIDTIAFSYSDQTDFTPTGPGNTNFDCEAFIVTDDSIFLFTKRWLDQHTRIYALPNEPGTFTAQLRGDYNVQGLVTGATMDSTKRVVSLCGYSSFGQPFVTLLYDFDGHHFFSGNKRKLIIDLPISQVEGITTRDAVTYYLTNEQTPIVNTPQALHKLDLSLYLQSYLDHPANVSGYEHITTFPNPSSGIVRVHIPNGLVGRRYVVSDVTGLQRAAGVFHSNVDDLDLTGLCSGVYFLRVSGDAYRLTVVR